MASGTAIMTSGTGLIISSIWMPNSEMIRNPLSASGRERMLHLQQRMTCAGGNKILTS
jgi:hypothetical protein